MNIVVDVEFLFLEKKLFKEFENLKGVMLMKLDEERDDLCVELKMVVWCKVFRNGSYNWIMRWRW